MEKNSFSHYKKTLSIVLCLTYILQFSFWGIARYFMQSSTNNDWAFFIGFWGINILLIFLVDFFHVGLPKTFWDYCSIIPFLIMSACCFYTLYYRIYWITIVVVSCTTIVIFTIRHIWSYKFSRQYCEKTKYLKEESVIRISIYILPTILLSFICSHLANIIPHSSFFIFVRFIYFVVTFGLIAITYFVWHKNILQTISPKQLCFEISWLLFCYLSFVLGIDYFKESVFTFLLPIFGVIPILIRHKDEHKSK